MLTGLVVGMAMALGAAGLLWIGPWNALSNFTARKILQPGSPRAGISSRWVNRDTEPAIYWVNFCIAIVGGTAMAGWLISIAYNILSIAFTKYAPH